MFTKLISIGALVLAVGVSIGGQTKPHSLQGAWKVVQVTTTGADARTISSPQPGLYLFTAKHYAVVAVQGDQPRPNIPPGEADKATAEQLRATWGPFTANAGTYELSGETLITKPMVAKNPGIMQGGSGLTFSVKLEGDSVTVVTKTGPNGPVQNPTTVKLTRVE